MTFRIVLKVNAADCVLDIEIVTCQKGLKMRFVRDIKPRRLVNNLSPIFQRIVMPLSFGSSSLLGLLLSCFIPKTKALPSSITLVTTNLHGVTSQKTCVLSNTAVITSVRTGHCVKR
jgi:hypothetical protein